MYLYGQGGNFYFLYLCSCLLQKFSACKVIFNSFNQCNILTDCQIWNSTYTHTHPFNGPFPGLPRWAGTRKVKPIWILLKQETVSGSGSISWVICKSASRSKQITMPTPHYSLFYRPDALPAAQPTASKHWRHKIIKPVRANNSHNFCLRVPCKSLNFNKPNNLLFCNPKSNHIYTSQLQ